jgi:phosphoglycolate phosphatase
MTNYQFILFDLDGTITDPGIGITNSVMYALKKFDIEVSNRTELYKFIGPPLLESFQKYYGFSKEKSKKAIDYYRDYYKEKGINENFLYEGFEDLLINLKNNGKTLLVATSKPEIFAKQILEHFKLEKYFSFIGGASLDSSRSEKDKVISYVLESCNIHEKPKTIMVGDRKHDIIGAKKNGIDSIGVLFGYGDREELETAGATYIAEAVKDIEKIIIEK